MRRVGNNFVKSLWDLSEGPVAIQSYLLARSVPRAHRDILKRYRILGCAFRVVIEGWNWLWGLSFRIGVEVGIGSSMILSGGCKWWRRKLWSACSKQWFPFWFQGGAGSGAGGMHLENWIESCVSCGVSANASTTCLLFGCPDSEFVIKGRFRRRSIQ